METSPSERELRYHLLRLGDDLVAREDKLASLAALDGAAAIPLLVERLSDSDDPLFLDDREVPTGPMNPGPPIVAPTTVRFEAEARLYEIISGEAAGETASSPYPPELQASMGRIEGRHDMLGGDSAPPKLVDDWAAWWKEHEGDTIEQIRAWAAAERDRRAGEAGMLDAPGAAAQPRIPVPTNRAKASDAEREAYARAKTLFEEARADRSRVAAAETELAAIGEEPRLAPHTEYMLWKLRTNP